MARPSKSFGNHNNLSRWRWSDPTQSEVASDLIVRLRPHLKGPTCFYPVVAGVPMQPLHLKDCPPGLDIAFIADDWPLDFSQFSLRESPQLQAHLHQLAGRSGTLLGNFHQGPANIMLAGQRPGRSYVCDLVIILLGCASIVYGLLPVDDWDRHVPNICLLPIIVCPLYFLNEPRSRRATFAQNRAEWAAAVQETVLALKRCSGMTLPPKSSPPAGKPVIPA